MRKNLLIAGAVVSAALLMSGCMGGGKKTATENKEESAVRVKVENAITENVARTEVFTANLRGYKEQQIIPATSQRIDKIYVEVGDRVKEGQLLVELNKLEYFTNKTTLDTNQQTFDRMSQVHESGGISKQQLDELEAGILQQQEVVRNLEENLSFRAPFSGIVTRRNFEEGDVFSMSAGVGILQIMQIDRLKAYVGVSEQYFSNIYIGMPVRIETDIYPDRQFEGKVSRIDPAINSATRTFEVEITIPNSSETLRPGMFARATVNMGERESVTVQDLAVQRQPGTNDKYLFVVENGTAVRRPVTTGRQVGSRIEILSGVAVHEPVIVAGMARLRDGARVEIVN